MKKIEIKQKGKTMEEMQIEWLKKNKVTVCKTQTNSKSQNIRMKSKGDYWNSYYRDLTK